MALGRLVISGFVLGCSLLAADLNLTDANGRKARLRDYKGQVVILNFWATWCGPCKEEMPLLVDAEKEFHGRVIFIAASLDDSKTRAQVPDFVAKYHIAFPVWTGATSNDLDRLAMGDAVPDTAFVDRDGKIVARVLGEIRKGELIDRIEWLLGDRSSAAPESLVRHLPGK